MKDTIVEEIRQRRQEHARRFDYDLDAIFEDLKEKESESERRVVARLPRQPRLIRSTK